MSFPCPVSLVVFVSNSMFVHVDPLNWNILPGFIISRSPSLFSPILCRCWTNVVSVPGPEILPSRQGKVSERQQPEHLHAYIESQTCHKNARHCHSSRACKCSDWCHLKTQWNRLTNPVVMYFSIKTNVWTGPCPSLNGNLLYFWIVLSWILGYSVRNGWHYSIDCMT